MKSYKNEFVSFIRSLQNTICSAIEKADGQAKFHEDLWKRDGGGGGKTRIIKDGLVFEKGGVNISEVYGKLPESMQQYLQVEHNNFFACGLSLVLHSVSPMVPTVHANFRYFELYDDQGNIIDQWFGGGSDLTPYYLFESDAKHFHMTQKAVCDRFNATYFDRYKQACDNYFYNHHRNEARGIGGTFYDHLRPSKDHEDWYSFVTEMGSAFLDSYIPIVEARKPLSYTAAQKEWQEIRRGRYVEFNLIHDKGTLFGLRTNGRIESILMSLPATVRWEYNHQVDAASEEAKLIQVLKEPKSWVE